MRVEIFEAKTVEDAKKKAIEAFGVSADKITFEVLEEKRGLFKKEARIQASYSPEVIESAPEVVTEAVEEVAEEVAEEIVSEPVAEETTEQIAEPVAETVVEAEIEPVAEKAIESVEETYSEKEIEPTDAQKAKAEYAVSFLKKILSKMDIETEANVKYTESGLLIDLDSEKSGSIIGRRGETLDALQYLVSMLTNRGDEDYLRITLDSANYREKRKVALQALAKKLSASAIRYSRSVTLEPMNPYERRIIHATVSEIEGVSSRSVGEEPYRKVIISSDNAGKREGKDNRRRGGNSNRHKAEKKNYQPIDLSTSFEKEYKRPKPEDEIGTGLYGKIEL